MLLLKLSSNDSQRFRSATVLRHDGSGDGAFRSYFCSQMLSQPSSVVSSGNFPAARPAWHLRTHFWNLARFFPTLASVFKVALSGGMKPVSSPPKGVCARAAGASDQRRKATRARYLVIAASD